jgi:hypothetical protein
MTIAALAALLHETAEHHAPSSRSPRRTTGGTGMRPTSMPARAATARRMPPWPPAATWPRSSTSALPPADATQAARLRKVRPHAGPLVVELRLVRTRVRRRLRLGHHYRPRARRARPRLIPVNGGQHPGSASQCGCRSRPARRALRPRVPRVARREERARAPRAIVADAHPGAAMRARQRARPAATTRTVHARRADHRAAATLAWMGAACAGWRPTATEVPLIDATASSSSLVL